MYWRQKIFVFENILGKILLITIYNCRFANSFFRSKQLIRKYQQRGYFKL